MQYVTCPLCGANLDPGERCDCKEKEEPPHANELGPSRASYMPKSIISHFAAEHKDFLRELRTSKEIPGKEIVKVVKARFPGYDKMLQSKCENPAKYGVGLVPEAMQLIIETFAPELLTVSAEAPDEETVVEDKPSAAPKRRGDTHRLKRRLHCRLEEADYDALMEYIHEKGFDTVQAWLTYVVRNVLKKYKNERS